MPSRYRNLRRTAYLPDPDRAPWTARYRALRFPEAWRGRLLDLCNARRPPEAEPIRTVPTWGMDNVLQSLAPDLVVRGRGGWEPRSEASPGFWLYAPADLPHPLPNPVLATLVTAWLRDLCPENELRDLRRAVTEELTADLPQWEETEVDLLGCTTTNGGTAAPQPYQFQLATDALARRIAALEPYDTGAHLLRFRAVPHGPRDQGAELISQPLPHESRGTTWWFSVRINITLHTAPFSLLPRLHVHLGIRRWATVVPSGGRLYLPYTSATSVLLRPEIPWLPGMPPSDRYARAHLVRDRRQEFVWKQHGPAGILRDLPVGHGFPDPADLLSDPRKWIGDGPGVRAGIVHHTRMGSHKVGTGLMPHQRSQFAAWIEQALPEGLRPAPDLVRAGRHNTPANALSKAKNKATRSTEEAQARRAAIAVAEREFAFRAIPDGDRPVLEARLLWQTPQMRDTAIAALADVLDLPGDGGAPAAAHDDAAGLPGEYVVLRWETPELEVRLRCLRLPEGLGDPLDIGQAPPRWRALAEAIADRRARMAAALTDDGTTADAPTLALVELGGRRAFPQRITDPKFALRLGAADAGVLTQFVEVATTSAKNPEKAEHRARSGWLDGLRQLGVRVLPEHTLGERLPTGLRYAALWMVKRRKDGPTRLPRHVPVAVLMAPIAPGSGQAVVTAWDDEAGEWIPYPALLLRLTRIAEVPEAMPDAVVDEAEDSGGAPGTAAEPGDNAEPEKRRRVTRRMWRQNMAEQRQATEEFLQHMLRSLRGHATLLLTASQNSRMHWSWLQDGHVVADRLCKGDAPPTHMPAGLRLVRVRTSQGRETPQWWCPAEPPGVNGFAAGLWAVPAIEQGGGTAAPARLFYSTTAKPDTAKHAAVEADKLAQRPMRSGPRAGQLTVDTEQPAWNPGLMEIAVLGCHPRGTASDEPGDDPEAFATVVHQLRQAPDYRGALALPLPLHLAAQAQEYVLPTLAEEDGAPETEEAAPADADEVGLGVELLEAPALLVEPDHDEQLPLF
ncbi:pPIWI_RE module domain-containing protein [Streptomonospora nanhaiensis]|uniref:pPIWI_RE module domain-containing protein n=1 Tax=Streptomonospora nanhaiensis TaxID=1323731 RepID=UPI001C9A09A6|nr:DUF3962 domain-containing protein [Streptomonospora nanhaiensis]